MAWSDRPGHWYFAPAYGYVGLVPSESDESSHGNRTARVIATGYWNDAMPLVRYDTGDTIEFESSHGEAELREIAVGKRPFWRVHGRNNDFILSPDGAATQNLDHIIRDRPSIRQAQFVQSADFSIRLKIIPNGVGLTKSVLNDIHRLSRERIPGSVGFSVEVVNHLEPGPGEKVAFVVRDRSLRPSHA
jgi:phenylacetate-CoA ligase